MFHRLGPPSPSSSSTAILPGRWFSSSHRTSLSRFDSTSSIASAARSSAVAPALRKDSRPRSAPGHECLLQPMVRASSPTRW